MDDAEYIFRQDIKEKKSAGRGSFHRKCGSKSKKCTLPHEYLTKKEKEALNSTITSWNMNSFYDYATFKTMPQDLQIEYLQSLTDKYKISCSVISEVLFKSSKGTLASYLEARDIFSKIHWNTFTGMKARVYNAEFTKVVNNVNSESKENTDIQEPVAVASSDEPYSGQLKNTSISMDGFDLDTFTWLAQKYFGQNVTVTILVEQAGMAE